MHELYHRLLQLRQQQIIPRLPGTQALGAEVLAVGAVSASWRLGDGNLLRIDLNLSAAPVLHTASVGSSLLFEHPPHSAERLERGTLAPYCALVSLTAAAPLQPPMESANE
jgi:maltooligosyltrehalose trehalohydrolase